MDDRRTLTEDPKETRERLSYTESVRQCRAICTPYARPQGVVGAVRFVHRSFSSSHSSSLLGEDHCIEENLSFSCPVCMPGGETGGPFDRAIILLHGLNERYWDKYMPWAYTLAVRLGVPVIMFPIAFHMDRGRPAWSDMRRMNREATKRRSAVYGGGAGARTVSCANCAMSERIGSHPERSVRSGIQTIGDVEQLVRELGNGTVEGFSEVGHIDLFGYSIGCTILEALLMKDQQRRDGDQLFKDSQAVLFCGGAVLCHTDPVRRGIIDQAAFSRLHRFFVELSHANPEALAAAGHEGHNELQQVDALASLLQLDVRREFRERLLGACAARLLSVCLTEDTVFPPAVIRQTLEGILPAGSIRCISVHEKASHEMPFPVCDDLNDADQVDKSFQMVFDHLCAHYQMDNHRVQ
jgi:pimeloyl-ACP methyl ester carboxylesterase